MGAIVNLVKVVRNRRGVPGRYPDFCTYFCPPFGPGLTKMHFFGLVGSVIEKSPHAGGNFHVSQLGGGSTRVNT